MNKMTQQEREAFDAMSVPQRARWLLEGGVTARVTIDPDTLSLKWTAQSRGIQFLAQECRGDGEAETIAATVKWLNGLMAGGLNHDC